MEIARLSTVIALLLLPVIVNSADFYVDSNAVDANGTGASSSSPYKYLGQLPTSNFLGNTNIFLKCGSRWRESLSIINSSINTNTVNITRYGSDCTSTNLPVIDGAEPLTGWVADPADTTGKIFTTASHISAGYNMMTTQLIDLASQQRYPVARFPNLDDPTGSMRLITQDSTDDPQEIRKTRAHYLIDKDNLNPFWVANSNLDPVGAELHIRNRNWRLQDRIITNFDRNAGELGWYELNPTTEADNTKLKISQALISGTCDGCVASGYSYYLANLKWMLDQAGEWYQDRTSKAIYLQTSGAAPIDGAVSVSVRDYGIYIELQASLYINYVKVINTRYEGIRIDRSYDYHIDFVDISNAGATGLWITSWPPTPMPVIANTVTNNQISNTSTSGIRIESNSNENKNVDDGWSTLIQNNNVTNIGNVDYADPDAHLLLKAGAWKNDRSNSRGVALAIGGDKNYWIDNNRTDNTVYSGMQITGKTLNPKVTNNRITNFCTILDDGGGIYLGGSCITSTATNPGDGRTCLSPFVENGDISGNIVGNGIGNAYGVRSSSPSVYGIYLDSDVMQTTINNNTVHDIAGAAVFIHDAQDNTITNNLLFANNEEILFVENLESGIAKDVSNIAVNGNRIIHTADSEAINIRSSFDDFNALAASGTFSNNHYFSALTQQIVKEAYVGGSQSYSISEWQNVRGQASGTTVFGDYGFSSNYISAVLAGNLIVNSGFDNDVSGWGCWFPGKSGNDCPFSNTDPYRIWNAGCGIGNGGCMTIAANSNIKMAAINSNLPILAGANYILEYTVQGASVNQTGSTIVRKTNKFSDGYGSLGLSKSISIDTSPVYVNHVFTALDDYAQAAAYIYADNDPAGDSILHIDDYTLTQVESVKLVTGEVAVLVINDTSTTLTYSEAVRSGIFDLNASYVDEYGININTNELLNPGDTRILIASQHSHMDSDRDGVADNPLGTGYHDRCISTAKGKTTDRYGCSFEQKDDWDSDGLSNLEETARLTDLENPDTDGDSLSDGFEVNTLGTDPLLLDTDGDGYNDDVEVYIGSDPLNSVSIPADGDINGDNVVNVVDALLATQIALGFKTPTADELLRGDVAPLSSGVPAPNGVFDTGDLVLIQRKVFGLVNF